MTSQNTQKVSECARPGPVGFQNAAHLHKTNAENMRQGRKGSTAGGDSLPEDFVQGTVQPKNLMRGVQIVNTKVITQSQYDSDG